MIEIVNSKLQIENSLKKAVKDLTGLEIEPVVELQTDLSKGDYSTNIAMTVFARIKGKAGSGKFGSPMELAEEIIKNSKFEIRNSKFLDRVEVKEPGFINFWLSPEYVSDQIKGLLDGQFEINRKTEPAGLVVFEFGDPNPFKDIHIGHLRNFAIGESLCRFLEAQGNKVVRASYQGDVGLHVAKAIYGIQNSEFRIQNIENMTLEERTKFLGEAYALGARAYEEDLPAGTQGKNVQDQINKINIRLYKEVSKVSEVSGVSKGDGLDQDGGLLELWQKGRKWSLEYFEELYQLLGIKYDKYYFESQTAPLGKEIVEANSAGSGPAVFEKHEGAFIFRGDAHGLHTRVFVTKEGYATYEGKDLALAVLKDKDFPNLDRSIIMTANEQVEYFKVVLKALEQVNKKIADKTRHLSFGFVNLKSGKMSSRTGNVVSAFWLIDEIKKRLKSEFKEVSQEVLDDLSVGAVKWSMLRFSRESNISFDISESIDLAGNSGPYMQYTFARTRSILAKSGKDNFEFKNEIIWEELELALARLICQFKNVISDAGKNFSPNILTNYLFLLAQNFNNFYEKEKVIGSNREMERLAIVGAVGKVLQKGLHLLGIEAPGKI